MHAESLDTWRHEHVFLGEHHARNERRSWAVVLLCAAMMVAEIVGHVSRVARHGRISVDVIPFVR